MTYRKSPAMHLQTVNLKTLGGIEVPTVFSNLTEEYRAIREEVAVVDYSFNTRLRISGLGASKYLQQLITKDLDYLTEEQTVTCLMLKEDGTLVAEIIVYVMGDSFMLEVTPEYSLSLKDHLQAYVTEDVRIEDVTDSIHMILLEGPKSWEVAQALIPFPIEVLPYKNFVPFEEEGHDLFIARLGYTAEYGYKIFGGTVGIDTIWEKLFSLDLPNINVQQIGVDAIDVCRLEVRFPDLSKEYCENHLVVETGVNWLIDFNKDFIGKERSLEMLELGLQEELVCFTSNDNVEKNQSIVVEDLKVGYVQHTLFSPGLNKNIGVAYLKREYAASGLSFGLEKGMEIETASSPLVYAKSLTVRMG